MPTLPVQLHPPRDDQVFEDLCLDLFSALWDGAQLYGRRGHEQKGIDIYGTLDGEHVAVQCKMRDGKLTKADVRKDIESARAHKPGFAKLIFATTAKRDPKLQDFARDLKESFEVEIKFWDDLEREIQLHDEVFRRWQHALSSSAPLVAVDRLPHSILPELIGREKELKTLDDAWSERTTRAISVVAVGGAGKTALVHHWMQSFEDAGWQAKGAAAVFAWSFYSQGAGEDRQASGDLFIAEALKFFGDRNPTEGSPRDRGLRLAGHIRRRRTLLILDGLEPLQEPPSSVQAGKVKDPAVAALIEQLASDNPGLLVVTTREPVRELESRKGKGARSLDLETLSDEAGAALLRWLEVKGRDDELQAVAKEVHGHALTLTLLGTFLRDAHGGDVRAWKDLSLLEVDDLIDHLQASRVMDSYLRWLGTGQEEGRSSLLRSRLRETVPTLDDRPKTTAEEDELERRPFASVLAQRIKEVQIETQASFAVHLHGPWGAGKTSVLNFLSEELWAPSDQPWIVVHFDAWQHQHRNPPWWPFIREMFRQAQNQLPRLRAWNLWRYWIDWKFRTDWLPVLVAAILISISVALFSDAFDFGRFSGPGAPPSSGVSAETSLKVVVALASVGAALLAASRSLLFGSSRAAASFLELKADPLRPLVDLFGRLVSEIRRPVAVMIDDLDRCQPDYVVDLIEGIQTLFREAPVTYVVAADREWIRTSFEKRYADFSGQVGDPGRPLGFLFLEKIFQVSAALPNLSSPICDRYWDRLLQVAGPAAALEAAREKEQEAEILLEGAHTEEILNEVVDSHRGDPLLERGLRAAAAKRITSPQAREHTEHILSPFRRHLETSPRAMKRLVNAFGLQQAVGYLTDRRVRTDSLARWTILELRWPVLANLLARNPDLLSKIHKDPAAAAGDPRVPEPLGLILQDEAVLALLIGDAGECQLTATAILQILGKDTDEGDEGTNIRDNPPTSADDSFIE